MKFPIPIMVRAFALTALWTACLAEGRAAAPVAPPRGGRVGWARLVTPGWQWNIHNGEDLELANFIRRETNLNIDPVWHSVDAGNLAELCAYPFIYVKALWHITDAGDLQNIQEYLRRGGFICVDPCKAVLNAADVVAFPRQQAQWFTRLLPECAVRELPDDHAIFRCYFTVRIDDLFPPQMLAQGATKPPRIGMQGVFLGERMVAVICDSGLECGWTPTPARVPGCQQMIANIYVYAMTRATEVAAQPP